MNAMEQLLESLARLKETKIQFMLDCQREAIMVTTVTPLAYYEIEVFADGHIDVQAFAAGDIERMNLKEISEKISKEMGD